MLTSGSMAVEIVGHIRVQPLGPYLVRIEQKGPNGFEDRETFTVLNRDTDSVPSDVTRRNGKTAVSTAHYRVTVQDKAKTFEGVRIESLDGKLFKKLTSKDLQRAYMPSPSALPKAWVMADHPRAIPPEWGALPAPNGSKNPHSGWDIKNSAPDLYVFLPEAAGYEQFRSDFIRLTGPVPIPPLYAFGLWYSRYHPYSEERALELIDTFRKKKIPLDVFVCDTDWRVGASHGYGVNEKLFPNMKRFIKRAHDKNVYLMYNDHPEPVGKHALSPKELKYRYDGLSSLLKMGADIWWFDRNWHTHLQAPMEGLNKEVWGMRLYSDVTRDNRPRRRPLIMSNVDGIDNGHLKYPSHPAAHRFPVWWTGDTRGEWAYLKLAVENGVNCGIHSLLPYVNEDLGGHHDQPEFDLYTRYMQFGALCPITRIHCSAAPHRYPWLYGEDVEKNVGDYFRLRYRLLPTIYSAAYEAYRDGTPIMRRCDLEWPQHPEAADSTQYLFGNDLLVAPIVTPASSNQVAERTVWIPEGRWEDVWTGRSHVGPKTITVKATLEQVPMFVRVGGIVISIPQTYFTKGHAWSHVVLDAYVPTGSQETTRVLYEDDGMNNAYTKGTCGITDITLRKKGSAASLEIVPSQEFTRFQSEKRKWTIRLHLPAGKKLKSVKLNGTKLARDKLTVLRPSNEVPAILFEGPGTPPPPKSGSLVEIPVPTRAVSSALAVDLAL